MRLDLDPAGGWLNRGAQRTAPITVLFVWALSCSVCKAQMPAVRRLQADPRVQFVSVHTPISPADAEPDRIAETAASLGLTAPIALDDDGAIADALAVRSLPAWFVFDAEGLRIAAAGIGSDRRVEEAIRSAIAA